MQYLIELYFIKYLLSTKIYLAHIFKGPVQDLAKIKINCQFRMNDKMCRSQKNQIRETRKKRECL